MPGAPRFVQRLGLAILVAGLVAGAAVYVRGGSDPPPDAVEQRREMIQVERLGGRATVQTVKFDQWMTSLWHGERLGLTLAALGLLVGGACWRLGVLMDEDG